MDKTKCVWVVRQGICMCPRCLVTVEPEQTHCLVCGYGMGETDIYVGCSGYDDHDCSGLLEED